LRKQAMLTTCAYEPICGIIPFRVGSCGWLGCRLCTNGQVVVYTMSELDANVTSFDLAAELTSFDLPAHTIRHAAHIDAHTSPPLCTSPMRLCTDKLRMGGALAQAMRAVCAHHGTVENNTILDVLVAAEAGLHTLALNSTMPSGHGAQRKLLPSSRLRPVCDLNVSPHV